MSESASHCNIIPDGNTMETLERHRKTPIMSGEAPFEDRSALLRRRAGRGRLWRRVCAFVVLAGISTAVTGLVALKDRFAGEWRSALADFKWVVLVSGDQIQVDEVGRFLHDIDAVGQVTLLPPSAVVERLRNDPVVGDQFDGIEVDSLPSVWLVAWTPAIASARLDRELEDVRRLPGVVDVGFDRRELVKASAFRDAWLRIRLLLAALAVLGIVVLSVLLGRFLFFTDLSAVRAGPLLAFMTGAAFAWLAGLGLGVWLLGPVSWHLAWGGAVAAIARLAWGRVRDSE